VLEKVFTLTSNVDSLTKDVERLNGAMKEHHERIVRLEGRDELIAEKAKKGGTAGGSPDQPGAAQADRRSREPIEATCYQS
jgi:hypothetical protein